MKKKPKRKVYRPNELEAFLSTPPHLVSYYLRQKGEFEGFLIRLENEAKIFLKQAGHSTVIDDIAHSLDQFRLPYTENEEKAAYVLLATSKLRDALSISDAEWAAIQMAILFSAATYAGVERAIIEGIIRINARSIKRKTKEPREFILFCREALKKAKRRTALSIWKWLINNADGIKIEYHEDKNKFYEYDAKGGKKPIGFRAFQSHLARLKKVQFSN